MTRLPTPRQLEATFARHTARPGPGGPLVAPDAHGLVSVSGGGDSTALLLLLDALREKRRLRLEVLHFDHGLRPESAAEAEWVAALAERLGLPFHLRRGFVPPPGGRGVQAAARRWRRAESEALARTLGADWIATGHQRDDHVETLLLKLLRGAHLSNLDGIAPRQGPWLRPLLPFAGAALRAYLRAREQTWIEDPSNRSGDYTRNRVRHELVPLLEQLTGGSLGTRLDALAAQSRDLADWLGAQPPPTADGPDGGVLDASALAAAPALVRTHWLRTFLDGQGVGAVDFAVLQRAGELAGGDAPWSLDLPGGTTLRGDAARIAVHRREPGGAAADVPQSREIDGWRVIAPAHWRVRVATPGEAGDAAAGEHGMVLHNVPPGATLTLRTRRAGDRFEPPGRGAPLKLGEYLRARGVPREARDGLPVVLVGERLAAVYPDFPAAGFSAPGAAGVAIRLSIDAP